MASGVSGPNIWSKYNNLYFVFEKYLNLWGLSLL